MLLCVETQWRIQKLPDRGEGCRFKKNNFTHHSWVRQPIEGSGGMLPRKMLKSKASNGAFWSIFRLKYGRVFVFETLHGGGGSGSATDILGGMVHPTGTHGRTGGPTFSQLRLLVSFLSPSIILFR